MRTEFLVFTVEARHSAYVRNELGQIPFPEPFDVPLDFNEVYSLAALFIKSCPESNPSLPVKAFPVLTASMADDGSAKLTPEDTSVLEGDGQLYAIWIGSNGNQVVRNLFFLPTLKKKADTGPSPQGDYNKDTMTVEWPYEQFGQRYVVLSTSKDVSDDTVVAGPAIYESEYLYLETTLT